MSLSRLIGPAEWKIVGAGERLGQVALGHRGAGAPHLGVVLAAWDPAAAAESVDLVLERLRGLKGVKWSMVVVANNEVAGRALARDTHEYRLVAGSNREAEFSAYEEGRQALLAEAAGAPDVWVILNDRLPFYKVDPLWGVTPGLLRFASTVPIAAGTIDFLPDHFHLRGQKFRCYIRANYILASATAVDRVGSLCAVSADEYATEVPLAYPGRDWPISAWIGPELGEPLRLFLTVPGGVHWARAEPLVPASWPRLRMKALSIVNEWLLSLRFIEARVPIVPWRLARAMSGLSSEDRFLQGLLEHYRSDAGFGGGLENSAPGRMQLAAGVLAARAGATRMAETFLASAAKLSVAARTTHPGQRTWWAPP